MHNIIMHQTIHQAKAIHTLSAYLPIVQCGTPSFFGTYPFIQWSPDSLIKVKPQSKSQSIMTEVKVIIKLKTSNSQSMLPTNMKLELVLSLYSPFYRKCFRSFCSIVVSLCQVANVYDQFLIKWRYINISVLQDEFCSSLRAVEGQLKDVETVRVQLMSRVEQLNRALNETENGKSIQI